MARKDALLRLHQRLIAKRDALRLKLDDDSNSRQMWSGTGDVGDAATDGETNELNTQLAALESRELLQINRAIQAIRKGHYGICEVCENPIPIARLQALPFTAMCIDCQREQEESGGAFGDLDLNWESVADYEGQLSEKEFTLGDLDVDQ